MSRGNAGNSAGATFNRCSSSIAWTNDDGSSKTDPTNMKLNTDANTILISVMTLETVVVACTARRKFIIKPQRNACYRKLIGYVTTSTMLI